MIHVEDKSLSLPDGRTLAYADNGNTSSSDLVLFLHGAFSVGYAARLPPVLLEHNLHYIAPSLPGWGKSSPMPAPSTAYPATLAADMTCLVTHLHPTTANLRLYLCGHSFGTVPAQILHSLPHHIFPLGRQIVALVLLAPLSPPHCHTAYARTLSWQNYLMFGPPARYAPFNLVMHLAKIYMNRHLSPEAAAEIHVRNTLTQFMDDEEREVLVRWMEDNGMAEGQFEREMAHVLTSSVAHSWQGFLDIPAIYHFGWGGSRPEDAVNTCPVLVISSRGDFLSSEDMARWLATAYKSAGIKHVDGNRYSLFLHLDDIWDEIFRATESPPR